MTVLGPKWQLLHNYFSLSYCRCYARVVSSTMTLTRQSVHRSVSQSVCRVWNLLIRMYVEVHIHKDLGLYYFLRECCTIWTFKKSSALKLLLNILLKQFISEFLVLKKNIRVICRFVCCPKFFTRGYPGVIPPF